MNNAMWGAAAALLMLSGCTPFAGDGGFTPVAQSAHERLDKDVRWVRTSGEKAKSDAQIAQLLRRPLTVDDAVQIALLSNRGLQASFEELGISEADLVQSGRLPNPRFTLRRTSAAGLYDIEETLSINVLSLLTVPYVHAIEKRRFAEVQERGRGRYRATGRPHPRGLLQRRSLRTNPRTISRRLKDAAEAGAELARRMRAAGNWNRIDEARERSFYIDAASALARARRRRRRMSRENLDAAAGRPGGSAAFRLAERLPDLPRRASMSCRISSGRRSRTGIDLQMMRARIDALAQELHLTKATRFVNVLDAGPARVRQGPDSEPYESGYEVSLEVPIFDGGAPRVRKAEAIYAQAVDRFGQAAIEARAEVRKAYARYLAAHEIAARERDEVLPLRQIDRGGGFAALRRRADRRLRSARRRARRNDRRQRLHPKCPRLLDCQVAARQRAARPLPCNRKNHGNSTQPDVRHGAARARSARPRSPRCRRSCPPIRRPRSRRSSRRTAAHICRSRL